MNTIYACGIKINPVSVDDIVSLAEQWVDDNRKGFQITGVNVEQIALLEKYEHFASYVNGSDVVNIDGVSVCHYLRLKGYKVPYRTLCADIMLEMLHRANERRRRIFLLGAEQQTLEELARRIKRDYEDIEIVGLHNGFFKDEQRVVDLIAASNPDYLFIGMPSPFKERFISTYKGVLNAGVCFGVGGMFDIMAGKAKRAPEWAQRYGLEWLYRIGQNPIGHTKRVFRALVPCMKRFVKYMFEPKRQEL